MRARRLGRYTPREPEVLLSDEQPASLRALPVQHSLLDDRYDSLQARNLIETRSRAPKRRRAKRKEVLRESHKDTRYKSPHLRGPLPAWL